jgi:UDP:flavonoid glycosyltransferase YjiC (YdhE family)
MGFIGNKLIDTELGTGLVEHTFKNSEVQKLLNSDESFDVVIIEHFLNEALIGIAHHFNAPVVFLAPVASCAKNNYLFGNPSPSSYVPDLLGSFTKHMNFWQRLENFLVINYNDILREILYIPKQRELFKKYVKTNLELDDLLYNISLMLTTSHPSVTDAVPHLPNIIEIGGYHVSPPKDLPRDLQEYMDNATDGVVLFSMGSNLKSKDLTLDVRRSILGAFSKLKEKVLWKFETDLPEASPNVKVMKWLPQQDILGHPNIKAFITHGGLLSTIEAVYYGVPIIGIPVFGDQRNNMEAAVSNGYGVSVLLQDLTEKTFSGALSEILNNPK